jgi:hypothetical protein
MMAVALVFKTITVVVLTFVVVAVLTPPSPVGQRQAKFLGAMVAALLAGVLYSLEALT